MDITNTILDTVERNLSFEVTIQRRYSGRFMYGSECIGVVTSDMASVIAVMSEILDEAIRAEGDVDGLADMTGDDAVYQLQKLFQGMRHDDMGTSMIWYFPDLQVSDD